MVPKHPGRDRLFRSHVKSLRRLSGHIPMLASSKGMEQEFHPRSLHRRNQPLCCSCRFVSSGRPGHRGGSNPSHMEPSSKPSDQGSRQRHGVAGQSVSAHFSSIRLDRLLTDSQSFRGQPSPDLLFCNSPSWGYDMLIFPNPFEWSFLIAV